MGGGRKNLVILKSWCIVLTVLTCIQYEDSHTLSPLTRQESCSEVVETMLDD